jgi:hypothetical protein
MRVLGRRKSLADRLKLRIRQIVGRKQGCSYLHQRLHHILCQDLNSAPPTYGIALGLEKAPEFSPYFPTSACNKGCSRTMFLKCASCRATEFNQY